MRANEKRAKTGVNMRKKQGRGTNAKRLQRRTGAIENRAQGRKELLRKEDRKTRANEITRRQENIIYDSKKDRNK